MERYRSINIFSLEISGENGRIRISAYENLSEDEKTIRHHEYREINDLEVRKMCAGVVDLLNRKNRHGKIDTMTLRELQTTGHLLYDTLLTGNIKKKLTATKNEYLIISLDDRLVHIPWELLYDGERFLCRRFNMGRVVSTSQRVSEPAVRQIKKPMRMLIIADPRSDLGASYKEGVRLRNELDNNLDIIEVNLRSGAVDVNSVKGELRRYDFFHYAGHADYDIKNPGNSGFLMGDGKLTASDIINMIGPTPLPSLVFSNACKSGHTEMWSVEEDYETEIYGLANAFLLAGVQHYIGTFWEVQDEPGLYFASDFYKELMKGSMVGEAVRKARMGLIERYGENTIVWASYMLYGDPTARYVDSALSNKKGKGNEGSERRYKKSGDKIEVGGSVRGADAVLALPPKKKKWVVIGSVFFIILAFIIIFSVINAWKSASLPGLYKVSQESDQETKSRRIDELVAALIKDYRENRKTGEGKSAEAGQSGLPTLVFLNIKANGITEADKEYIFTGITDTLRSSKRVKVVEREILDRLLEELKLSSSQLADPAKVLEVGKILSAQMISTGSISRDGRDWLVSLRLVDTETTSIQAALTERLETDDREEVTEILSREILNKIKTAYPLQGK